jgi:hypothetical protein
MREKAVWYCSRQAISIPASGSARPAKTSGQRARLEQLEEKLLMLPFSEIVPNPRIDPMNARVHVLPDFGKLASQMIFFNSTSRCNTVAGPKRFAHRHRKVKATFRRSSTEQTPERMKAAHGAAFIKFLERLHCVTLTQVGLRRR